MSVSGWDNWLYDATAALLLSDIACDRQKVATIVRDRGNGYIGEQLS
jgi:hypothetical protein